MLAYAFPLLQEVYSSDNILKGDKATRWDVKYMETEQCHIIETLYEQLSQKAIKKLHRIAKGRGIYNLGVKNELKFEGDINNCKSRTKHAFSKVQTYYLENK